MSENQPYNNVFFKYWPFICWYEAFGTINPFKEPKCALELKLLNFKNFVNCKHFICLPAWLHQSTYSLNYWAFGLHFPSTKFISVCTNLSLLLSSVSRLLLCILHDHYHSVRLLGAHGSLAHIIYRLFFKICNFKKGNRDRKSKNYANKLMIKNHGNKMELNCCYRRKVNSKAFAIPILTTRLLRQMQ